MSDDDSAPRNEGPSDSARRWIEHERAVRAAAANDAAASHDAREQVSAGRRRDYDNRVAAWIGLAVALILVVLGWILIDRLITQNRLEDCVMAHRHNCASGLDLR